MRFIFGGEAYTDPPNFLLIPNPGDFLVICRYTMNFIRRIGVNDHRFVAVCHYDTNQTAILNIVTISIVPISDLVIVEYSANVLKISGRSHKTPGSLEIKFVHIVRHSLKRDS